jgi:hypothetical protein
MNGVFPSRRSIAESILGEIDWKDASTGFLRCPASDLHRNRHGKRDCWVKIDGAPTIKCMHSSCAGTIADKNKLLRSAIGKSECGANFQLRRSPPTLAESQRERQRQKLDLLRRRTEASLGEIVAVNSCDVPDLWEASPVRLHRDAKDDWRLILQLFGAEDVVWIGDLRESGEPRHARNFRTVANWLKESEAPGQHVCPNPFKAGVCSRSAENVVAPRFLVVESDPPKGLLKNDFCSVLQWLKRFLRLRAVVDTANKSLHGWFEYPASDVLRELRTILPALKCDGALFQQAHPCRLPGALRNGKRQHLIYLDLESVQ